MYSSNVKQFGIRHVLIAIVIVGIGMGLVSSKSSLPITIGILILIGVAGWMTSFSMMFISDLIDDRRIDDRKLTSRFFNCLGLMIVLGTLVLILFLALIISFQFGFWVLD